MCPVAELLLLALGGDRLYMCSTAGPPTSGFGGAFEQDVGTGTCRWANTATGGCGCTAGASAHPYVVSLLDGSGSQQASIIYICSRASLKDINYGVRLLSDPI